MHLIARVRWNLCAPEYIVRPGNLVRRLTGAEAGARAVVPLYWGLDLEVNPREMIGRSLVRKRAYELVLSEVAWRLLDEGETAVDAGAHVGYFTSLFAARAGHRGRVLAFEPHPVLCQELIANVHRWAATQASPVTVLGCALSDTTGPGLLSIPEDWDRNRGVGTVSRDQGTPARRCDIRLTRLDDVLPVDTRIGVMKLDVEDHQEPALRGARALLERRSIRDILFEDHGTFPTPAMRLLETAGYTLFSLAKRLSGPRVCPPDRTGTRPWDDPNYVATSDPDRLTRRLNRGGWRVLSPA